MATDFRPWVSELVAARRPVPAAGGITARERSALLGPRRGETLQVKPDREVSAPNGPRARPQRDEADDPAPRQPRAEAKTPPNSPSSPDSREIPQMPSLNPPAKPPAGAAREGPVVKFPKPEDVATAQPYPRQIENWELPSLTLLEAPSYGLTFQQETFVREQAKVLERTLEEFRLDAHVVEIDTGPVITMFELRLGAGIKVSQIAMLSNDIARALKVHAIRVVAPISGKNTVGIEVPNLNKEQVRLRELIQLAGAKAREMALPLLLGKDAGGTPLVGDLTTMPHLLIAGTTGSGKSVCLNAIILSVLMTQRPDRVKLILIDPKMVELNQFKDVPHLMCPIVTDMIQGEKILEWAVTKMDERYELLAEARVRNIRGYNELGAEELYDRLKPASEEEKSRIPVFLPYIVILMDELADLMMTSAKEVEHHLSRLAQKSRAVGVHIIVATQRPEVKVVTGLIKSNLPCRICFRVASRMDSRIVLDQNGGEVLMGQGDMLFLPPGSHKLIRAQGTYLRDAEVQAVLDDLASRSKPDFHPELISLRQEEAEVDGGLRDPLFDEAVRIILESRRGSVSLLQRRLTIGYSRASRLIDQMAAAGIVGEYKGSQAREVRMTPQQWESLRNGDDD
jgi:S-DNA-T family DNA segregation ATPase FtsK/SpoIIIE